MLRKVEISFDGISCAGCTGSIEQLLEGNKDRLGICSYTVRLLEKDASITISDGSNVANINAALLDLFDPWAPAIKEADEAIVTLVDDNPAPALSLETAKKKPHLFWRIVNNRWVKAGVGLVSGIGLMALMLAGITLAPWLMIIAAGVSGLLTLYVGWESYYQAFNKLIRTKTLTMDALFTLSTLAAIGVSIAHFFIPGLPMMFDAALLIFGFRHLGKGIEESVKGKITANLRFQDRAPSQVTVLVNNTRAVKPLNQLQIGDVILVAPNSLIPIDGKCLSDQTKAYNTILTGKVLPVTINKNDDVFAGMRTSNQPIQMLVSRLAKDSYLARQDASIEQAYSSKADIEEVASKALKWFIPAVIILAVLVGLGLFFGLPLLTPLIPAVALLPLAIKCGLSILVSACPCTLGLITPLAIRLGIAKGAENGVTFKTHDSLQKASEADVLVFDLNGTLTQGEPVVTQYGLKKPELLDAIIALQNKASHPIAKAIAHAFSKKNKSKKIELSHIDKSLHCGIEARYQGKSLCIGNAKMMQLKGIDLKNKYDELNKQDAEHITYIAYDHKIVGYALLTDPLRKDAKATIDELRRMNKSIYICTGADRETALKYAKKLGIPESHVKAGRLGDSHHPQASSKTNDILSLQQSGKKVAMIGDAGNDALALANSHLGIAVQSPSSDVITMDKADVTINNTSLLSLVSLFEVAKQSMTNVKQNLGISLSYNVVTVIAICSIFVVGAIFFPGFLLTPAIGAGLMAAQAVIVLLNAYRFKKQALSHAKRAGERVESESGETTRDMNRSLDGAKFLFDVDPAPVKLTPAKDVARDDVQGRDISTADPSLPLPQTGERNPKTDILMQVDRDASKDKGSLTI